VGGVDPGRGRFTAVVSLDLYRFDQLLNLDEASGEAVLGAGVTGPAAERLLGEHGFSLGHFPQSFEYATMAGSRPPGRRVRIPPGTAASTTWSAGYG
jgi:alkyldihydroxyacetonephosphate synthase